MQLETHSLRILETALYELETGFAALPDVEQTYDYDAIADVILEVAARLRDNYPYFTPSMPDRC